MRYDMSLPWWAWALMGAGLVAFIIMVAASIRRNNGVKRSLFAAPYTLWMIIFTIVPVVLIGYYAFTDASGDEDEVVEGEATETVTDTPVTDTPATEAPVDTPATTEDAE